MMLNYFMDLNIFMWVVTRFFFTDVKFYKEDYFWIGSQCTYGSLGVRGAIGSVYVTTQSEVQGLESLATRSLSNLW